MKHFKRILSFFIFIVLYIFMSCNNDFNHDVNNDFIINASDDTELPPSISLTLKNDIVEMGDNISGNVTFSNFTKNPTTIDIYIEGIYDAIASDVTVTNGSFTLSTNNPQFFDAGCYKLYVKSRNIQSNYIGITIKLPLKEIHFDVENRTVVKGEAITGILEFRKHSTSYSFSTLPTIELNVEVYFEEMNVAVASINKLINGRFSFQTTVFDIGTYNIYVKIDNIESNHIKVTINQPVDNEQSEVSEIEVSENEEPSSLLELDPPIIKFVGSNLYDYSDKFTIECTNYEIGLNTIDSSMYRVSIYYTKDGSDPLNSSTNLQYDDRNNFISNKSDAGTSTIKAVAVLSCGLENLCYSEIIEQTFIRKEYQVKFTSKIDYKYLPNNFTTYKTHYQPRYIPIEGYNLKGFKVGNIEYECGDKIEISKNTTIEYVFEKWKYPCTPQNQIPSNFTRIEETDSPFETFKFTVDYLKFEMSINRTTAYTTYTLYSGTLRIIKLGGVMRTYAFVGGYDENNPNMVKLTSSGIGTKYIEMYVNCNTDNDYFYGKRQLYVNLKDFENL